MTRADVSRYRDHLLKQGLQPATVIKRLGHLSAMVQTYVDAGRLERNVALRMRVPRSDTTRTRLPSGDEPLQSVFASPIYTQGRRYKAGGREAAAWLPALATGGRLEELGQLRVRDIQRHRTNGALKLHEVVAPAPARPRGVQRPGRSPRVPQLPAHLQMKSSRRTICPSNASFTMSATAPSQAARLFGLIEATDARPRRLHPGIWNTSCRSCFSASRTTRSALWA